MIITYNELVRELANKELLFFKHYHVNSKEIKCPLEWWEKYEPLFSKVGFLVMEILSILGPQIETKHIFSLVAIHTNFKRCLQCDDLDKLIFVNKN